MKKKLKGEIIVGKEEFKAFKKVCEELFSGTYKIKKRLKYSYLVDVECGDMQDLFSIGQIFEQYKVLQNNTVTPK